MPAWHYDNKIEDIDFKNSIFFAGPTLRFDMRTPWRVEATRMLGNYERTRNILIPEFKDGLFHDHVEERFSESEPTVSWEFDAIMRASIVMYWMPFDKRESFGLTTRSEVAADLREALLLNGCIRLPNGGKKLRHLVLGMPPHTPSSSYIRFHANLARIPIHNTLAETLAAALKIDEL